MRTRAAIAHHVTAPSSLTRRKHARTLVSLAPLSRPCTDDHFPSLMDSIVGQSVSLTSLLPDGARYLLKWIWNAESIVESLWFWNTAIIHSILLLHECYRRKMERYFNRAVKHSYSFGCGSTTGPRRFNSDCMNWTGLEIKEPRLQLVDFAMGNCWRQRHAHTPL